MGSEDVGLGVGDVGREGTWRMPFCSAWDRMPIRVPNGLQNSLARPEGKTLPENSFILFICLFLAGLGLRCCLGFL